MEILAPTTDGVDAQVMGRLAAGETEALRHVYRAFSGPIYSLLLQMLGRPEDAQDLLQEVFAKIWTDASNFDARRGAPIAWAITITRFKAIDRIRSNNRRTRLREALETQAATRSEPRAAAPDREMLSREDASAVAVALKELPDDQRQAIELAYFRGLSQSEIAGHLGQPLTTIKGRIRRAMDNLRDSLKGRA